MPGIPNPSPSAPASKIGCIGYSYYEHLCSDPIPPPGFSFGDFLYGSAQRIILKIELCDFLDARQWMKAEPTGCPTVQGRPQRVESRPHRIGVQAALIPDGFS